MRANTMLQFLQNSCIGWYMRSVEHIQNVRKIRDNIARIYEVNVRTPRYNQRNRTI